MARPTRSASDELREILEQDLVSFARYINPHYSYGEIHEEVFRWLSDPSVGDHQLLLMPRAHLKSHCIAVWCVWWITKHPDTSIVYLSAGEDLTRAQIGAIKGMITSDQYRALWPEMINKEEFKRSKWAADSFNVDHPLRKQMGIRDLTLLTKTVKSNFTGLHCDVMIFDDVVVPNNAYTEIGRKEVRAAISQCASIINPGGITKAVGTIYHPSDIYNDFKNAEVQEFDEETGELLDEVPLWDIRTYTVEHRGDMTGDYLWPRTINPMNGKGYGFNIHILAKIKAKYFSTGEQAQFYAQYYNDPNDPDSEKVSRNSVQIYDKNKITFLDGNYYYSGRRLKIFAAMDVAWTVNKGSDYTVIAVIGIDEDWNIFVLSLDRFKTQDYDTYYEHISALYNQWQFRKIHVETNAGGLLVAEEIKRRLRQNGAMLVVEGKAATSNEGKKEEKHDAVLIPRVKNGQLFMTRGGLTDVAIEEIVLERPPHDDIKDALTAAIANATPPAKSRYQDRRVVNIKHHKRFGGIIR